MRLGAIWQDNQKPALHEEPGFCNFPGRWESFVRTRKKQKHG